MVGKKNVYINVGIRASKWQSQGNVVTVKHRRVLLNRNVK